VMAQTENEKLLDQINRLETAGMNTTKQWYELWSESMRYVFSDHDRMLRSSQEEWEFVVLNYIWPTMIQEIAKLSKNFPKIIAQPTEESDTEAAEIWQGAVQWQWNEGLKMRLNQIAAIQCGKIFGYRVSMFYNEPRSKWNKQTKSWENNIKYRLWHPAFFWSDGVETVDDGNCGTVRWVRVEWAKKHWPGNDTAFDEVAVVAKDSEEASFGDSKFQSWMSGATMVQTEDESDNAVKKRHNRLLELISGTRQNSSETVESDQKYVRISNCYFHDYTDKHVAEKEPFSAEEIIQSGVAYQGMDQKLYNEKNEEYNPEKWPEKLIREYEEPVFPDGRNVLSAGQGDKRFILNPKKENQVYRYSRWPFVVVPHYLLPFMWQGVNAVTLYKGTQDMINVSVTHLYNNLKQHGDPRIAIEDGAIALNPKTKKPWSIRSGAGALIRLLPGGLMKYKIEPPVQISQSAVGFFELCSQDFKNMTGLQDVGRGLQLKSGTTATEAQMLTISTNDRIYLQSVFEDYWVEESAKLIAEIMQDKYDIGRFIRIVGDENVQAIQQITDKLKSVKYDIKVQPGTTLPFDEEKRIARYKMAYDLLQNPVVNPMLPEMLRELEIGNVKKLLAKYEAWQDYVALLKLVEGVKAGQVAPEQAMQMIVNRLMEIQGQSLSEGAMNNEQNSQENNQNSQQAGPVGAPQG